MTPLSEQQKELLFSYCLGLTSEIENAQVEELIFSNSEAAGIVASIKAALSPLETVREEECPQELAQGTVWRAQQAVRTGQLRLGQLLAAEQKRKPTAKVGFWNDIFGRLATAAVFIIVGSLLITGIPVVSNYAHQKYWQTKCAAQLGGLFTGLSNYKNEHNGQIPTIAAAPGAPWYRVGEQGPENVSNTRRMWLLAKNNYVKPNIFLCPARKTTTKLTFTRDPQKYNDFPSRMLVQYSFRLGCPAAVDNLGRQVICSDVNPLFENIVPIPGGVIIILNEKLLKQNSTNHQGRGQNVLFCDGSVMFVKTRTVDVSMDDIYTLQNTQTYQGVEMPASEKDAFLAP